MTASPRGEKPLCPASELIRFLAQQEGFDKGFSLEGEAVRKSLYAISCLMWVTAEGGTVRS